MRLRAGDRGRRGRTSGNRLRAEEDRGHGGEEGGRHGADDRRIEADPKGGALATPATTDGHGFGLDAGKAGQRGRADVLEADFVRRVFVRAQSRAERGKFSWALVSRPTAFGTKVSDAYRTRLMARARAAELLELALLAYEQRRDDGADVEELKGEAMEAYGYDAAGERNLNRPVGEIAEERRRREERRKAEEASRQTALLKSAALVFGGDEVRAEALAALLATATKN